MSKADQLAAALDAFLGVSPDVEAAAVVSADGLPMASALPPYVEEDRLAAMSAALLTLGERAAEGLGKGELAQVFVEGAAGYVVLMSAGANAVLVTVTSKNTKVGLVLFEMRKAATDIRSIMERSATESPEARESWEQQPSSEEWQPQPTAPSAPEGWQPEPAPVETDSGPSWHTEQGQAPHTETSISGW